MIQSYDATFEFVVKFQLMKFYFGRARDWEKFIIYLSLHLEVITLAQYTLIEN